MVFIVIGAAAKVAKAAKNEYEKDEERKKPIQNVSSNKKSAAREHDWWGGREPGASQSDEASQASDHSHGGIGAWSRDRTLEKVKARQDAEQPISSGGFSGKSLLSTGSSSSSFGGMKSQDGLKDEPASAPTSSRRLSGGVRPTDSSTSGEGQREEKVKGKSPACSTGGEGVVSRPSSITKGEDPNATCASAKVEKSRPPRAKRSSADGSFEAVLRSRRLGSSEEPQLTRRATSAAVDTERKDAHAAEPKARDSAIDASDKEGFGPSNTSDGKSSALRRAQTARGPAVEGTFDAVLRTRSYRAARVDGSSRDASSGSKEAVPVSALSSGRRKKRFGAATGKVEHAAGGAATGAAHALSGVAHHAVAGATHVVTGANHAASDATHAVAGAFGKVAGTASSGATMGAMKVTHAVTGARHAMVDGATRVTSAMASSGTKRRYGRGHGAVRVASTNVPEKMSAENMTTSANASEIEKPASGTEEPGTSRSSLYAAGTLKKRTSGR